MDPEQHDTLILYTRAFLDLLKDVIMSPPSFTALQNTSTLQVDQNPFLS